MHIKNIHKEDPENPVKYDQILVSPKEVNKLLTAETAGDGKTSGRVVLAAISEDFVNVDVIEPVEDIRPAIAEPDTGQLIDINVSGPKTGNLKVKHPKKSKVKAKKKDKVACYDFRRLSNLFNNPEFAVKKVSKVQTKRPDELPLLQPDGPVLPLVVRTGHQLTGGTDLLQVEVVNLPPAIRPVGRTDLPNADKTDLVH